MRRQLIEKAAFEVAHQVRTVEDSIDSVLGEIAELQSKLLRARSLAGVGIRTGHEALENLVVANQALVGARAGTGGKPVSRAAAMCARKPCACASRGELL